MYKIFTVLYCSTSGKKMVCHDSANLDQWKTMRQEVQPQRTPAKRGVADRNPKVETVSWEATFVDCLPFDATELVALGSAVYLSVPQSEPPNL